MSKPDLYKTNLCYNKNCKYKDKCNFAHTFEELNIRECVYDDKCKLITVKDGKIINNSPKICSHKHRMETKDEFKKRITMHCSDCEQVIKVPRDMYMDTIKMIMDNPSKNGASIKIEVIEKN